MRKQTIVKQISTIFLFVTVALVGQQGPKIDIQIIAPISVGETQVYPLGWSRQGHFAYLEAYDIGGLCGFCPRYNIVITSAVTDEVLATAEFDGSIMADGDERWSTPSELYERERNSVESLLGEYAIEPPHPKEPLEYGSVPFTGGGREYTVVVDVKTVSRQWQPFEGQVEKEIQAVVGAEMRLSATGLGQKIAFSERPDPDSYAAVIGYDVHAYVASQFEPRVVLLVERRRMGAESERGSVLTVGVHLTFGYK